MVPSVGVDGHLPEPVGVVDQGLEDRPYEQRFQIDHPNLGRFEGPLDHGTRQHTWTGDDRNCRRGTTVVRVWTAGDVEDDGHEVAADAGSRHLTDGEVS